MINIQQRSTIEYQKRIQKALSYIIENLDSQLSLKEVAKAASFSEYHFHRIFSTFMKESLGEYITRKKLEKAAIQLAYSQNSTVSQVAFDFGYSSVSSFSKSFHKHFGIRPSKINKIQQSFDSKEGKLQIKYDKFIEKEQLFVVPEDKNFSSKFKKINSIVEIKTVPEFVLHYITSPKGYDFDSIKNTWVELVERLEDAKVDINYCDRFAISHDHPGLTPAEICRYDACVALLKHEHEDINLTSTKVPSGRYALFRVEGPKESILNQYLEFYTIWMPNSGYEPDNFPVLEHYLPPFDESYIRVELWAKIKRLAYL